MNPASTPRFPAAPGWLTPGSRCASSTAAGPARKTIIAIPTARVALFCFEFIVNSPSSRTCAGDELLDGNETVVLGWLEGERPVFDLGVEVPAREGHLRHRLARHLLVEDWKSV